MIDYTANDCSRHLWGRQAQVALGELKHGSSLDTDLSKLKDRSILIATRDQLTAALALIELDGVARRLTLLPPGVRTSIFPQSSPMPLSMRCSATTRPARTTIT